MRALLALGLMLLLPQLAHAADWRYCLAPSHAQRKVYISPPFPATMPMDDVEIAVRTNAQPLGVAL